MSHESMGPIDDEALDTITQLARTHRLVDQVYVDVDEGGRRELHIDLNRDRYPRTVETASIYIQWHTNDDYTFHYRDVYVAGDAWQCRWDRHPHTHDAAREHFHEPPTAVDNSGRKSVNSFADPVGEYCYNSYDRQYEEPISDSVRIVDPHHLFTRTMANVNERINQLWETESL